MPGERTPMAKRKEAAKPRKPQKAKKPKPENKLNDPVVRKAVAEQLVGALIRSEIKRKTGFDVSTAAPETVEVKPHARRKPARLLGNGLPEIEAAKKPRKTKAAEKAPEVHEGAIGMEAPEPLDPSDETDAEIIRISDELVASETRRLRQARKLTHTNVRAALRETAGVLAQAAEILGCSRPALYQFIKRHGLEEELEQIRDDILDQAEATIKLAIMGGNLQTAMWYLTKMGHKRGYAERHTVQQLDAQGQPTDPRETILAYKPVLSPDAPPPVNPVL